MDIRKDFPLLEKITFLDNGAGTLKPLEVIEVIRNFYTNISMNAHSADTPLGIKVVEGIEDARKTIADFVDATPKEVIFTSGTTDGLNKLANMFGQILKEGDEILLSTYNHHSNIVPFIEVAKKIGAKIVYAEDVTTKINDKTALISVAQVNNALGPKADMKKIYDLAQKHNAYVINDAAQAVTSVDVSLKYSDAIAFSSNKIFGPTGSGALVVREDLLKQFKPTTFGGGATWNVTKVSPNDKVCSYRRKNSLAQFEPGTPDAAGILAFVQGIKYFLKHKDLLERVHEVAEYAYDELSKLEGITILSERGASVVIFDYKDIPGQDIVSSLANKGIYMRAGSFCATLSGVSKNGSNRVSVSLYNTKEDIDKLIVALKEGDFFGYL